MLLDLRRRCGWQPQAQYPTRLLLEPTNHCTLSCPLCPTGSGTARAPRGMMAWDQFTAIADELTPHLLEANLWGYGEPYLHPRLDEMIARFVGHGVRTRVSSNGQFLAQPDAPRRVIASGLTVLKVSLDGCTEETYAAYRRGGSWAAVRDGLVALRARQRVENRAYPKIVVQFIAMRHNEHELPAVRSFARQLGCTLRVKAVGSASAPAGSWLPRQALSRYAGGRPAAQRRQPRACPFPWQWAVIAWDGCVLPCCKDPHREHSIGVIGGRQRFADIWTSAAFTEFRRQQRRDRTALARCRECVLPVSSDQ